MPYSENSKSLFVGSLNYKTVRKVLVANLSSGGRVGVWPGHLFSLGDTTGRNEATPVYHSRANLLDK
jgi:hypothetical protein